MYLPPPLHRLRKRIKQRIATWQNLRLARRVARGAPCVIEDDTGFRFVFHDHMRPCARNLLHRAATASQYDAIRALVRPGDTVFDVGAHIGRFSLLIEQLVGDTGRIFAFEPVPDTYWSLRECLALNRSTRVIAEQAAICDRVGRARMNCFDPELSAWNTLGNPTMTTATGVQVAPTAHVTVPALTLDQVCERDGIDRIDFLKVDVEGFELAVFHGATRLLGERRIDRLCFEISQLPLAGAGIAARQVFELLESFGYTVYEFDAQSGRFAGPVHDSTAFWSNYYASARSLPAEMCIPLTPPAGPSCLRPAA